MSEEEKKKYIINSYIRYLRNKRNELLQETDKYLLPDFPDMNEKKMNELIIYRQKLREYMSHESVINYDGNDNSVISFPIKPNFINI